jgi:hypothetical protein
MPATADPLYVGFLAGRRTTKIMRRTTKIMRCAMPDCFPCI